MGVKTRIEWADATVNPITGCSPVSEGCEHCYAKRRAETQLKGKFGYPADDPFRVTWHPEKLDRLRTWVKPRRIFMVSMGDIFHPDVDPEWVSRIWLEMNYARHHFFLILTKRAHRMREVLSSIPAPWILPDVGSWAPRPSLLDVPLPNVGLGVSVENQARADERIPLLLKIPAAMRFISVEPMLGPVDIHPADDFSDRGHGPSFLSPSCNAAQWPGLDWVICGGETGPEARPLHPVWVRSLRDQCRRAEVPFFFKSWGAWGKEALNPTRHVAVDGTTVPPGEGGWACRKMGPRKAGRILDTETWSQVPEIAKMPDE